MCTNKQSAEQSIPSFGEYFTTSEPQDRSHNHGFLEISPLPIQPGSEFVQFTSAPEWSRSSFQATTCCLGSAVLSLLPEAFALLRTNTSPSRPWGEGCAEECMPRRNMRSLYAVSGLRRILLLAALLGIFAIVCSRGLGCLFRSSTPVTVAPQMHCNRAL
jgi:hypothetical protein